MSSKSFFVVWDEGLTGSTAKHHDHFTAKSEALRLARLNPGKEYHVLALMGTALKQEADFIESDLETLFIPF